MSLRARLALLFALLTAVGIAVVSALALRSAGTELGSETDLFLQNRAREVAEGLRQSPGNGGRGAVAPDSSLPFDPDAAVQALDSGGSVLGSSSSIVLPVSELDLEIARTNPGRTAPRGRDSPASAFRDVTIDGEEYRLFTTALPNGGAVQVARSSAESGRVLDSLRNQVLAVGLAMSVLAALVGWGVARQTTKPLRRLASAAHRVATTQDLDTPIEVDRADEVGQLARSFQDMLEALATSRDQQHRLVLDAGHELRTPLTSMSANIALLERADRMPPEDRAELLTAVKAELRELNELFSELIELATDTQDSDPFVAVTLADVAERAVSRLQRRTDRTVELHVDGSEVMGDPALLERALSNLLGNAHKFSPSGAPVQVVVAEGRVTVRDAGPGIAPADRERVFDRFFRSDATRAMPGSGLGLAIVAQVVRNHGGSVWATDGPGGVGAEVGFAIPCVA